jgi:hypothetical protein
MHPVLEASASRGDDGLFTSDSYSGIVMDAVRPGCGFVIGASKSPIADGEVMAKQVCVLSFLFSLALCVSFTCQIGLKPS